MSNSGIRSWTRLARFLEYVTLLCEWRQALSRRRKPRSKPSRWQPPSSRSARGVQLSLLVLEERSHPGATAGVLGLGLGMVGTGLALVDRAIAPSL